MNPRRPAMSPLSSVDARTPSDRAPGAPVVRLGWMLGGTLTMVVAALTIASQSPWTVTYRDAIFWGAVALSAALRYLDVTRYRGETTDGEPATMAHVRRYALGLLAVASVSWVAAQAIGI